MTYLGNAPGAGGFVFMRSPNNVLFYSTHCIFNESMFPKCQMLVKRPITRLQNNVPPAHRHHKDTIPVDEEAPAPQRQPTRKGKERKVNPQPPALPESLSEEETSEKGGSPGKNRNVGNQPHLRDSSPEEEQPPALAPGPRQSGRERKVPKKPGNMYSDHHPVDILRDPTGKKGRRGVKGSVPKPKENLPGPSRQVPSAFQQPPAQADRAPTPPISPTSSELDIERGLNRPESDDEQLVIRAIEAGDLAAEELCREGGVKVLSFLLAKAISPIAKTTTNPKEWGFKDLAHLPQLEQTEWQNACLQELEALRRCDVYELVPRPRGHKVIKNRWVFDVKTDGRK